MILAILTILNILALALHTWGIKKGYIQKKELKYNRIVAIALLIFLAFIIFYIGKAVNLDLTKNIFQVYLPGLGILFAALWIVQIVVKCFRANS